MYECAYPYCAFAVISIEVGVCTPLASVSTPKIIRHPSSISVDLNQKVELECVAEGAAVYDWYRNGKLLNTMDSSGKFVIEKAAPSDSGMYHCVATSREGGKADSKKAKVTVGMFIIISIPTHALMII